MQRPGHTGRKALATKKKLAYSFCLDRLGRLLLEGSFLLFVFSVVVCCLRQPTGYHVIPYQVIPIDNTSASSLLFVCLLLWFVQDWSESMSNRRQCG